MVHCVHVGLTTSSAIAERPRDACSTSNRKPVKMRLLDGNLSTWGIFEGGWVTSIAHFRWKGTSPTNTVGWQKTRRIPLSCGIKDIAGRFFGLVTKHACDRRTDGRTELRLPRPR